MFSSAFVARIATATSGNRVELFCRVDESAAAAAALPPEQNLGGFCFPVGPENVFPKEYSRPEVNIRSPCSRLLDLSCGVLLSPLLGRHHTWPGGSLNPCLMQEFSFTLTGGDGARIHGFCRQVGLCSAQFATGLATVNGASSQQGCSSRMLRFEGPISCTHAMHDNQGVLSPPNEAAVPVLPG